MAQMSACFNACLGICKNRCQKALQTVPSFISTSGIPIHPPATESMARTIKRNGHGLGAFMQVMLLFLCATEFALESECI